MADTKISALTELAASPASDDLSTIVDISDTTMAASGTNKKIQVSNALAAPAEVSVTGTTTITSSGLSAGPARIVWHVCSGTTSDYTVTLPAASGNAGKLIGFRMATGLTKFVTLDGNAAESIDGNATRIMWANESAILLCDGSNWFKVSGKTRPMFALMHRSTALSVDSATQTKVPLNTTDDDNTGAMADTTNTRINIKRPGLYGVVASVEFSPLIANDIEANARLNAAASPVWLSGLGEQTASSYCLVLGLRKGTLAAGDYLELYAYQNSGAAKGLYVDDPVNYLSVLEVPQW